jgi:dihydrofolate synthase/folylpolyglutamate synthase
MDYNITLGLESISKLCELLGNPQDRFKSIHITGTNGKGSTGAYIESILIENGLTVGRYTSPAVSNIFETITINRMPISPEEYQACKEKVLEVAKDLPKYGVREASQFELETAIAYEYLSTRCNVALIEVGMGGRLDATNVLHNKVLSVITSISLDHTQYLGNTLESITTEKCGIIQRGVPTVTTTQLSEVSHTIESICSKMDSPLSVANRLGISNVALTEDYTLTFDYLDYKGLRSKMLGDFQTDNATLAITACEVLNIPKNVIVKGIFNARWKYRFDIVNTNPLVILDGCHNADASKRLRNTLDCYFKGKSICYIMGIFKDKDYTAIVSNLCDRAEVIYTISTDGKRSLSAESLAKVVKDYNPNVTPCDSVSQAIALAKTSNTDVILVFGSLSTLAQFDNI